MAGSGAVLHSFAYGEHLEGPQRRSLGYRLLAPVPPEPWSAEVEALARRLQATPFPDHWPPTDLFCSVLLADGQRVVALARYGLADHTASHRRGGLELIGVIGPGSLGVPSALAVYHWLRQRRRETEDLRSLGGSFPLAQVLADVPPQAAPRDPVPVLPIRLWQDGALLFAASVPSDPDHHLGLLEQGAQGAWQWLSLVGSDFPVTTYAQRGPLIAWTPHLAGVALKLDQQKEAAPGGGWDRPSLMSLLWGGLLIGLLLANLGATLLVPSFRPVSPAASGGRPEPASLPVPPGPAPSDASREQFAQALYRFLEKEGVFQEWTRDPAPLLALYDRAGAEDPHLKLTQTEGKLAIGALQVLSRRGADQVEAMVREALTDKGYDPRLVKLACQRIRERLAGEKEPR